MVIMLWLMVMVIISWVCQTAVDYVAVVIGHYFISTTDYLLPRHKLLVGDCAHVCDEKVQFPERDVPFASHIYMRTISSTFSVLLLLAFILPLWQKHEWVQTLALVAYCANRNFWNEVSDKFHVIITLTTKNRNSMMSYLSSSDSFLTYLSTQLPSKLCFNSLCATFDKYGIFILLFSTKRRSRPVNYK